MSLTEEQKAEVTAIVTENIARYREQATQAQKDAAAAFMEEGKNPEVKQQRMAAMQEKFAAQDTDNDGRLSQAEYIAWINSQTDEAREKGMWVEEGSDRKQRYAAVSDSIEPDVAGISMANIMAVYAVAAQVSQAAMAEDQ